MRKYLPPPHKFRPKTLDSTDTVDFTHFRRTVNRYRGICSAIKCPLDITADDYYVISNGAVYNAIQAAYIVLRIMGYYRVSCLPSTIMLPASVWLPIGMFCSCVCMCECTTRIFTGLKIRIRSQMYGHLHVLHFILNFTASLYDGKYDCYHTGVLRSISRPIYVIATQMDATN